MGEGGGDEEEDGQSEDDHEDGHGSGGVAKRPGTQRRKLRSFYFRTGEVVRTTADNGRDVTAQCQVGGHVDCKKILIMSNGGLKLLPTEKPHTVAGGGVMQNLLKSMERGSKLLTGSAKQRLDKMFTNVIVQQDLPLQVGESDTMHDFLLEVSQVRYKGVSVPGSTCHFCVS